MAILDDEVATALLVHNRVELFSEDGKHTCLFAAPGGADLWGVDVAAETGSSNFVLRQVDGTEIWSGST